VLPREEYIEQAFFFRTALARTRENIPMQELLLGVREEVLATTNLPFAIDFMLDALRHTGQLADAMKKLGHYFTPFQTYVIAEAEDERRRFDIRVALLILEREAQYRADGCTRAGLFVYQFETLCRNRLRYDRGLGAAAEDPWYDADWKKWILHVRHQIGLVDFADLVTLRSEHYVTRKKQQRREDFTPPEPVLFGEKEGRIALANRQKDPLLLFAALQRQLGYPKVPLPERPDEVSQQLPRLIRLVEQLNRRVKMLEEESREGAVDLKKLERDILGE